MEIKEVKFMESSLVQNAIVALKGYSVIVEDNDEIRAAIETIMEGTSDFLRVTKTKGKTALLFNDQKGNMICAAVVEYNENDNEEGQDNYNYYWTFEKSDIEEESVTKYEANQSQVQVKFIDRCAESQGYKLDATYSSTMTMVMMSLLSDYLSENAQENVEFKINHEGFFTASSTVENGEIIKSLLPEGPMKTLIKDDATVEA